MASRAFFFFVASLAPAVCLRQVELMQASKVPLERVSAEFWGMAQDGESPTAQVTGNVASTR